MIELKRLYEALGLFNVAPYIQSGNVIFDCAEQDPVPLARSIETEIAQSFEISVRVFLRDKNRFQQIIDGNPFSHQRSEDPEKLHVTFLSDSPTKSALSNLPLPTDPKGSGAGSDDEFLGYDQEIYLFCPNGYGRTKFSNTFFERKLSVSATTRNWKTVNALNEIANQRGARRPKRSQISKVQLSDRVTTMNNNEFPGRRSIRLKEYDYSLAGGYFVTIVTLWREFLFGEIVGGEMQFNALGRIVEECWQAIPEHFPNTDVEVFVVMPNHVHGIIIIHNETRRGTMPIVGARHATSTRHTARFSWRNYRLIQILRHTAHRTGIEFRQHLATKLL